MSLFFFFQAEDGIRDYKVTGVQTCALPIFSLDEAKNGEVSPATLERAASEMARLFDIRYGGVGTEIGRGAWRGRGEISVVGGSFKKKKKKAEDGNNIIRKRTR